jgi:hypothetical protein
MRNTVAAAKRRRHGAATAKRRHGDTVAYAARSFVNNARRYVSRNLFFLPGASASNLNRIYMKERVLVMRRKPSRRYASP